MFDMFLSVMENSVTVRAHTRYADREGFVRRVIPKQLDRVTRVLVAQVRALMRVTALAGTVVRYVKLHGALGNLAVGDSDVAMAFA